MLNKTVLNLGSIGFNAQRQSIELDPGLPTSEIRLLLTGTVTVAGAAADAVILDDPLMRLISSIRVERDGNPIVRDIPGRDMDGIWRRHVVQQASQSVPTQAQLRAAGSYAFRYATGIPFATRWLSRPWDVHLPPLRTNTGLRLYIDWNQTVFGGAGSGAGSGALVDVGTDTYTFSVAPSVQVTQVGHPKNATRDSAKGFGVRKYEQFRTQTWAAATAQLTETIKSGRSFDLHLLRQSYGALERTQNSITSVSFLASLQEFLRNNSAHDLRQAEAELFPGVNSETGYLAILWAEMGMLTNIVVPGQHTNLRYEFNVAAPTAGNGLIAVTVAQVVRSEAE